MLNNLIRFLISFVILFQVSNLRGEEKKENTIVIGEATVKIKPDRAYINVVVNAKVNSLEALLASIKDKVDTLEKNLEDGMLRKEIPKVILRKYGLTPLIEKKVIGYKKEPESMGSDVFIESGDYIREATDKGVNIYRKGYIYEYKASQEFTIVIEDVSNINKIEQFVSRLSIVDENITIKQTPLGSGIYNFEPGVYVGILKYGFKEETSDKIRTETIYKAFEKAIEKANTLTKKLNLTSPNSSGAVIAGEEIYYGDNLIETGFIPVTARVKLIFYYQN